MKTRTICTFLFFAGITRCLCGTVPTLTAQVNVSGATTEYVYTLVNDLTSAEWIYDLWMYMPVEGGQAVTSATTSRPGWFTGYNWTKGYCVWSATALGGAELRPGETLVFTLITPAQVPTLYGYTAPSASSNWEWIVPNSAGCFGDSSLPVPVPEPSALLALAGGLGVLGLPFIRRRPAR